MDLNNFFANQVKPPALAAGEARTKLDAYKAQLPGTLLSFGFVDLDSMVRMLPANIYLVAARPGTGKTAFMKQVCGNVAESLPQEYAIVIFSAEMDAASLLLREACGREKLSYWKMVQGKLSADEYARLDRRLQSLGQGRIYIDDTPSPTVEHMVQTCQEVQDIGYKIGLIAFDYLGLAGEFDASESRRMQKISRGLASLAKQFDCPVLALHQTNRDAERDSDVGMRHLMSGGEQDATAILILERNEEVTGCINVHIVKHRHGPSGKMVSLFWDAQQMRFGDLAGVGRNHLDTGELELLPPPHHQYNYD